MLGGLKKDEHEVTASLCSKAGIQYSNTPCKFQIIYVNVSKEHSPISLDEIEAPLTVKITYSVTWTPTKLVILFQLTRICCNHAFRL